jgi:protein required for attachment to host cells
MLRNFFESETIMSDKQIRTGDWVVVCDGRKALILENAGDEKFLNLRKKDVYEHEDLPTHVLGSDKPGRVHSSAGTARSAVEQVDWHDNSERAFLETLAQHLDREAQGNPTRHLFLVAAPRALGMLREALTPAVQRAIKLEHHGDWVKLRLDAIEQHIRALVSP